MLSASECTPSRPNTNRRDEPAARCNPPVRTGRRQPFQLGKHQILGLLPRLALEQFPVHRKTSRDSGPALSLAVASLAIASSSISCGTAGWSWPERSSESFRADSNRIADLDAVESITIRGTSNFDVIFDPHRLGARRLRRQNFPLFFPAGLPAGIEANRSRIEPLPCPDRTRRRHQGGVIRKDYSDLMPLMTAAVAGLDMLRSPITGWPYGAVLPTRNRSRSLWIPGRRLSSSPFNSEMTAPFPARIRASDRSVGCASGRLRS